MTKLILFFLITSLSCSLNVLAQKTPGITRGHSHNDYHQQFPLQTALAAGMTSIEADVFLKNGILYVAHDSTEISSGATLIQLYLEPISKAAGRIRKAEQSGKELRLQLVIDIKENYAEVLKQLLKDLARFPALFDSAQNSAAIRIVISGDRPAPENFKHYSEMLYFDGRPGIAYTPDQLQRIGMISDDVKKHSDWKGKGLPDTEQETRLRRIVDEAHKMHKPFRYWATADEPAIWAMLQRIGVDFINTDHPQLLRKYLDQVAVK